MLKRLVGLSAVTLFVGACGTRSTFVWPASTFADAQKIGISTVVVAPTMGYRQPLYQLGYCVGDCPSLTPKTNVARISATSSDAPTLPKGLIRQPAPLPVPSASMQRQAAEAQKTVKNTAIPALPQFAPLYFGFNKANLELAIPTLSTYDIGTLAQAKKIYLSGYADPFGPRDYNLKLAQARINAVQTFLERELSRSTQSLPQFIVVTRAIDPHSALQLARRVNVSIFAPDGATL